MNLPVNLFSYGIRECVDYHLSQKPEIPLLVGFYSKTVEVVNPQEAEGLETEMMNVELR